MGGRDRRVQVVERWLALVLLMGSAGSHADAQIDYMVNCQGCHGDDGRGSPGNVPDLRGEIGLMLGEPGGRRYLVQVPGSRNAAIDNTRLAALLNWMVPAFSAATLPTDFEPYSSDEVGNLRRQTVDNIAAERARLIEKISTRGR